MKQETNPRQGIVGKNFEQTPPRFQAMYRNRSISRRSQSELLNENPLLVGRIVVAHPAIQPDFANRTTSRRPECHPPICTALFKIPGMKPERWNNKVVVRRELEHIRPILLASAVHNDFANP